MVQVCILYLSHPAANMEATKAVGSIRRAEPLMTEEFFLPLDSVFFRSYDYELPDVIIIDYSLCYSRDQVNVDKWGFRAVFKAVYYFRSLVRVAYPKVSKCVGISVI